MSESTRIKLLDSRLANQIAAGEVVERPASVVKELLENSIDSGATKIDLEVERGGARLIRITDNGKGIIKDDLMLALTRHATSKITTTDDLSAIDTLGFRGEALASIASISRLTLTSRPHDSELAWQAVAEGRDMAVEVLPASAAVGTRVEVAELFYNTPARQKFLRTEKTEFNHVEEVFKQHTLVNFSIAFTLKHNHKILKRLPACGEPVQYLKRVADICGKGFAENAVAFKCEHELMSVHGWLGKPNFHRSESDIQYVFINGRPVKDKTLSHAIRQAYDGLLPPGRMSTYVVYLKINPRLVDVNVHPTKHEVRFDQQRLVHDLLAKSISDTLKEQNQLPVFNENNLDSELLSEASHREADNEQLVELEMESSPVRSSFANRPSSHSKLNTNRQMKAPYDIHFANRVEEGRVKEGLSSAQYISRDNRNDTNESAQANRRLISPQLTSKKVSALVSIDKSHWIGEISGQAYFFNFEQLLECYLTNLAVGNINVLNIALLFPQPLDCSQFNIDDWQVLKFAEDLGFKICPGNHSEALVQKVPVWLSLFNTPTILDKLSSWMASYERKINQDKVLLSDIILPLDLEIESAQKHQIAEVLFSEFNQAECDVSLTKVTLDMLIDKN